MRTIGESVRSSLRKILADSHVAAVSIAVLLLWSLASGLRGLSDPFWRAASFVFTAVAILDIPFIPRTLGTTDQLYLIADSEYIFYALIYLAAAWILSRWVYGLGPLRSLSKARTRLARRKHV
jgi:hypothetical protein